MFGKILLGCFIFTCVSTSVDAGLGRPGGGHVRIRCPSNSVPLRPRQECPSGLWPPGTMPTGTCGSGAFCHPSPDDGPGLCCRLLRNQRPVPRRRPLKCPRGHVPIRPRQTCPILSRPPPGSPVQMPEQCGGGSAFCHPASQFSGLCCRRRRPRRYRPPVGRCPVSDVITHCAVIGPPGCTSDRQCGRGKRCCPYGCGRRRCMRVVYG